MKHTVTEDDPRITATECCFPAEAHYWTSKYTRKKRVFLAPGFMGLWTRKCPLGVSHHHTHHASFGSATTPFALVRWTESLWHLLGFGQPIAALLPRKTAQMAARITAAQKDEAGCPSHSRAVTFREHSLAHL